MSNNIVIGVGNILFHDDGIGVYAIKYIEENFDFNPQLELLDGGTLGFNLAEYFLEYDNVFILDTISTQDKPGTMYKIPSKELLGRHRYKNTAHEVEVVQMLEACELYDKKANITVLAITPNNISDIKIAISKELHDNFETFIKAILLEITNLGITIRKKNHRTLEDIIKFYTLK